jgi:hypothetical protein
MALVGQVFLQCPVAHTESQLVPVVMELNLAGAWMVSLVALSWPEEFTVFVGALVDMNVQPQMHLDSMWAKLQLLDLT